MVDFLQVLKQIRGTPRPSLGLLIESGFLQTPIQLFGELYGNQYEAELRADGTLIAGGEVFHSLSVAAGTLVTKKTGKRSSGRQYYACNGWLFWHVATANGQRRSLAEIRQQAVGPPN